MGPVTMGRVTSGFEDVVTRLHIVGGRRQTKGRMGTDG